MPSKRTAIGDAALEILSTMPTSSTNSLARTLFKKNPLLFNKLESARDAIRYYRGQNKHRLNGVKRMAAIKEDNCKLPETMYKPYFPFVITQKNLVIGYLCDVHIPYHEPDVVEIILDEFARKKINCLILGGDICDCYQLSNFMRDPTERSFVDERKDMKQFLALLRKRFQDAEILYIEGNHELRFKNYLKTHAPDIFGFDEFRLPSLYNMCEYKIRFIEDKRIIQCGHLNILHGHEYRFGGGVVNPARTLYLKAKACALQGHNHQTSSHDEPNINGDLIACWSVGCACYLHPDYMPLNKWNHGFAIIEKDGESFTVHNKRVIHGKIH